MFHAKSEYLRRLLFVLELAVSAFVFLAILNGYQFFNVNVSLDQAGHIGLLLIVMVSFGLSHRYFEREVSLHDHSLKSQSLHIIQVMVLTFSVTVVLIFMLKLDFVSRFVLIGFVITNTLALITVRVFLAWWYFYGRKEKEENYLNVLIIGSGTRAYALANRLEHSSEWGVKIVGFLDPKGESLGMRSGDRILGHVNKITEIMQSSVIDEVIIAVPRSLLNDVQAIISCCQEEGVRLRYMANFYDFEAERVSLTTVEGIPLLSFEPVARGAAGLIVKRMLDLMLTLAVMTVLLPMVAIVAIAVRIDSPGPVFFVQDRIGLHKRRFKLFKFRTMVVDAESRMSELEHLNEAEGPNFKIGNDPRVTWMGRILRKTSIDELPQLANVILGDMSLVGPRPMSLRDVDLFSTGIQRKRFSVRPGITCLWQVSGRSNLTFDEWLSLDLKYIENWSLWLDIKILFRTVPAVLKGSGAV